MNNDLVRVENNEIVVATDVVEQIKTFQKLKAEMDIKYPIDYDSLIKNKSKFLDSHGNTVWTMNYSDNSYALLISISISVTNKYEHYNTIKGIAANNLLINISEYEIFEYQVGRDMWKVILHKL